MTSDDDLRFAHALADAADAVTTARFRALDLRVDTKPDLTPVSEADRRAEEVIRELIGGSGREEGVLGEEFGDDGRDVRWIVDPIDGTTNYVRGVPVWATLLALEREGVVELAYVSAPALGRRWWAVLGDGAYADGVRCHVSAVDHVAEGSLEIACDSVMAIWDYSAPRLLVEEAGGLCTTFTGEAPAEGASFVATNGVLHDEAVALLSP